VLPRFTTVTDRKPFSELIRRLPERNFRRSLPGDAIFRSFPMYPSDNVAVMTAR